MNISYNWLKQYINTTATPDELSKILTSIGLEVGAVETVQTVKGGLAGLVIGEVLTCDEHTNSDHLHVTTINTGQAEPLQVVCGAPNVAAGQRVVLATVGTVLYSGEESFTIKKSKIRGVESFGMLCSEVEVGLGENHDGIMVLPADAPIGMDAKTYFGIKDDTLIEVDITPNRVDAASHFGVARDLAAYFAAQGVDIKLTRPSVDAFKTDNNNLPIHVTVENTEACPRYSGVSISGVNIGESPKWLQDALKIIGVRPINNVVDATNYVLHELGHPLHAFDADKITGNSVMIKTVAAGTKFTTLDEVERELADSDLMICNSNEAMCLAGVFGGADSGVTEHTTNLFIESAYFNPVWVRKSARRHGLNTDSSFRFERGADPNNTIYALKRVALLIQEVAGGTISSDIVDIYPTPIDTAIVTIAKSKIDTLIGKEIPTTTIEAIFKGLELEIIEKTNDVYTVSVPNYRVDVTRDVDIIEDILRLYGYNNVEIGTSLKSTLSFSSNPDSNKLQNRISEQLTANGFNEILNNSLTKGAYYTELNCYPEAECVRLMNALSQDLNVMRQTLLFGGLESISHNVNRRNADLKFYEFGNTYRYLADKRSEEDVLSPYHENYRLALWVTGKKSAQSWVQAEIKTTIYELKAHVQNILSRLGVDIKKFNITEMSNELYAEALTYNTPGGKTLATIASVSSKTLKKLDIDQPVFYADIDWNLLMKEVKKVRTSYTEISKFPEVKRDLALLIDKQVTFAEIEKIAYNTERKLLKQVNLFDVYEGKNLEAGKKSYAISFTLQDAEKTLTDKQIDAIMQKLIARYQDELGAKLR